MNQTELKLSVTESESLTKLMNTSPKPYIRERACALLHVSRGISCLEVSQKHLLKKRDRHTVSDWVSLFKDQGISGLTHKAGKGRHPAFFPPQ
jgi:transposase